MAILVPTLPIVVEWGFVVCWVFYILLVIFV